ncbi:hypothetical protein FPV67DRAFT_1673793 [Lyophyllum atratum]|nr:hypothetical protein FPV67DRAFT_1673793 [Lyophyllum atratum]
MFTFTTLFLAALAWQSQAAPIQSGISRRAGEEKFILPPPGDGPGPTFDATATRAATGAQIRSAASPDICFDVSDFRVGDFRFNLVPLTLKKCDESVDGQKFDLITKGQHNNVAGSRQTLIVSSQQFTCIDRRGNKDDRTRPGLFACGGRAAGDGETTADQLYFFNPTASLSGGIGFPIVQNAVNDGVGEGNQCLTLNADGFVSNTPCSPPFFTPEQTWIVEGSTAAPAPPVASSSAAASTPATTVRATSTATPVMATTTAASTTPAAGTPERFVLPVPAEGPGTLTASILRQEQLLNLPGPLFDATATRAATSKQIRSAASPDLCFDVSDFRAGDFRFNLVPLALKKCDTSVDGQKFDLMTKGVHNNVADGSRTLIVSSQQFTCVDRRGNKNDRTRPGLFACGGRAVGDGETNADQQYFFNAATSLSGGIGFPIANNAVNNGIGAGNQCLTLNADGFVSNTPCAPPLFTPEQTWIVG